MEVTPVGYLLLTDVRDPARIQAGPVVQVADVPPLDAGGDASYFFPGLGEGVDMFYAPGQAVALMTLFSSRRVAIIGFLEEALPFSDILPTATIAWFMEISGVFDVVEEFRP
eukprot:CAMPEP_0176311446 /NCGR_PEP_ID=MMETSP0121_2-20121125/66144_1 /TAXON_ID=160619 /ORGANISM="Kryptoperidinium foliaceum, Strain CCMP 1326" /LENGTH=111 /DNA_ID=CAMNT_0017653471 /DNA_START=58 /DNA_END=394 /DNA_ORIENTATION=-